MWLQFTLGIEFAILNDFDDDLSLRFASVCFLASFDILVLARLSCTRSIKLRQGFSSS
jgi:hypothetical protein